MGTIRAGLCGPNGTEAEVSEIDQTASGLSAKFNNSGETPLEFELGIQIQCPAFEMSMTRICPIKPLGTCADMKGGTWRMRPKSEHDIRCFSMHLTSRACRHAIRYILCFCILFCGARAVSACGIMFKRFGFVAC